MTKLQVYYRGTDWDFYTDPNIRDVSNARHRELVIRICEGLGLPTNNFKWRYFQTEKYYNLFVDWLGLTRVNRSGNQFIFSPETRKTYINALTKFLRASRNFQVAYYDKYEKLRLHIYRQCLVEHETKPAPDMEVIRPKLQESLADPRAVPALRVMASMILHGLPCLRPSDLQNTRLTDDAVHNFLDLSSKTWHIRSDQTKNGQARSFGVPDEFIRDVKNIVPFGEDSILLNKRGKPYEGDLSSVSNLFTGYFGANFNSIRSACVTATHNTTGMTIAQAEAVAEAMGHTLSTEVSHYLSA